LLLPLRYLAFPGNVLWTEEGYKMSWKMMLRTKTGTVHFKIQDKQTAAVSYHYTAERFSKMHMMWLAGAPDIIWQYAQRLKKEQEQLGKKNVAVYAISSLSMNRHKAQPLVDSTVDLAHQPWQPFIHSSWIVPFTGDH
jgi:hypothetical protein